MQFGTAGKMLVWQTNRSQSTHSVLCNGSIPFGIFRCEETPIKIIPPFAFAIDDSNVLKYNAVLSSRTEIAFAGTYSNVSEAFSLN